MNSCKADIIVAVTAVFLGGATVATKLSTDHRIAWLTAGMLAGGYAWFVLRYAIHRTFGVWLLGKGKGRRRTALAFALTVSFDWAGAWTAAALGGALAAGYPLDTSRQLFVATLRTVPWTTGIVGGLALAAALASLLTRGGLPGEKPDGWASGDRNSH